MLFPPILLFSSYLNVNSYRVDSAGITAAWSGLYLLLASRRKQVRSASPLLTFGGFLRYGMLTLFEQQKLVTKFGARGIIRGATLGLCAVNLIGCGIAYAFGKRSKEEEER